MTFTAPLDWWWKEYGQRLRARDLRRFVGVGKHLRATMGKLTFREVTTSRNASRRVLLIDAARR
jgi:hypothetical protein